MIQVWGKINRAYNDLLTAANGYPGSLFSASVALTLMKIVCQVGLQSHGPIMATMGN